MTLLTLPSLRLRIGLLRGVPGEEDHDAVDHGRDEIPRFGLGPGTKPGPGEVPKDADGWGEGFGPGFVPEDKGRDLEMERDGRERGV